MTEMFQLDFMIQAFALSVIVGILLSYLGVHVIGRGIVFVDLALGQISSLGVAYSDYIGKGKTVIPIVFTLVGAFLMSFINIRDKRLKLEAIIGIIYAVTSAITVMLISKTPHGDSDIQEVLFGNILSVSWDQIKMVAIIFTAIGLLHLFFFKKFIAVTESFSRSDTTLAKNMFQTKSAFSLWNFLFYISIGLSIVFAVKLSGVIPVFSFLIIPAVGAIMIAKNNRYVIMLAALISILGAFIGLNISYKFDFPAGSSIVAALGTIFLIVSIYFIVKSFIKNKLN